MKLVGSSEFFTDAQDCCTLLAWKYVFLGVYANSRQKSDRATFVVSIVLEPVGQAFSIGSLSNFVESCW